ncbi:hypothetical protein [uncultured Roseobacter sp.]|uniref:hypothetical protein n=1 Tax=uncultured Roseobacter sp. TaxID=114847 RepID=UPI00345232F5
MTDKLTPQHRSWNMSRIQAKDTKPEMVVRRLVHAMGLSVSASPHGPARQT